MRRLIFPGIVLFLSFLLAACATSKMDSLMPRVETMFLARHYFGEPAVTVALPDGSVRHEWTMDKVVTLPGRYVTQRVRVFRDRDGFPVYDEREIFVPASLQRQTCRLTIITDAAGNVLYSDWEGNSCDRLPVIPVVY